MGPLSRLSRADRALPELELHRSTQKPVKAQSPGPTPRVLGPQRLRAL